MTKPIDPAILAQLREEMGGEPFFAELVDIYLGEAPQLVANMVAALARADAPAMGRAAHTLKSTSATFGARELATLCGDVESIGQDGAAEDASEKVENIRRLFDDVREALEAQRDQGKASGHSD